MGELQATLDFSVELGKFHNVDLFQRGFYQIRAYFKSPPKAPIKSEVTLSKPSNNDLVFAQFVQKEVACGKTFQILYKKEEIQLNDVFSFKIHTLVDSHKIEECLNELPLQLVLELYFSDTDIGPSDPQSLQVASSRILKIHFNYRKGVHHHVPVLFDYFHLSAVTATIHGSLLAIHQPSISFPKAVKSGWFHKLSTSNNTRITTASLEVVLFGSPIRQLNSSVGSSRYAVPVEKIIQATQMHRYISAILLAAHEGLCKSYEDMLTCLPRSMRKPLDKVDYNAKLDKMCDYVQNLTSLDDVVETVNRDLAKLSAEMCIQWKQYLDLLGENHYVILNLMEEHHRTRVQRFSEGFFTVDNPREMAMAFHELNAQGHSYVSQAVKSSPYFHLLPPMQVECTEVDGDCNSLPVIFEERYLKSVSYNQVAPVDLDQIAATVREVKAQSKNKGPEISDSKPKPKLPESTADPSKLQKTLSETKSRPKFGTKSFIKNIKPESFRRPSSSRSDMDQVVLLGYRQYGFDGRNMSDAETELEREEARLAFMRTSAGSVSLPTLLISDLNVRGQRSSLLEVKGQHDDIDGAISNILHSDMEQAAGNVTGVDQTSKNTNAAPSKGPTRAPQLSHIRQHSVDIGILRSQNEKLKMQEEAGKARKSSFDGVIAIKTDNVPTVNSSEGSTLGGEDSNQLKGGAKKSLSNDSSISNCLKDDAVKSEDVTVSLETVTTTTNDATNASVPNDSGERTTTLETNETSVNGAKVSDVGRSELSDSDASVVRTDGINGHIEDVTEVGQNTHNDAANGEVECKNEDRSRSVPDGSDVSVVDGNDAKSVNANENTDHKTIQVRDTPNTVLSETETFTAQENGTESQTLQNDEKSAASMKDSCGKAANENNSTPVALQTDRITNSDVAEAEAAKLAEIFEPAQIESETTQVDAMPQKPNVVNEKTPESSPFNDNAQLSMYEDSDFSPMDDIAWKQSSASPVTPTVTSCLPFSGFSVTQTPICNRPAITSQPNSTVSTTTATAKVDHAEKKSDAREKLENIADPKKRFDLAKEDLKKRLKFSGDLMSDLPLKASIIPYFSVSVNDLDNDDSDDTHLIICVHGLDGNMADLRLVRTYIELGLPGAKMEFLMSEKNQMDTFADFSVMTDRLVGEILYYIDVYSLNPTRISFIGHSLGNIIIRSVLTRPEMKPWLDKMHTLLSLSGPHLGTMYNSSALVNTGMWFMQKWKKSGSLLQLALKDHSDPRETFVYKLSQKPGLELFKNVVLIGSLQDRYVPYHSARIEMCKNAMKDSSIYGAIYGEMINNILKPVIKDENINFVRYDVVHALQNTANSLIGRAAHIAVLDSEIFIEKFMTVCGLNFFK
ncbi:protein FAM135A-like [Glandiceps talaboti]